MVAKAAFIRFRETIMGSVPFNTMVANHMKTTKLDTKTAAAVTKYEVNTGRTKWPILIMPLKHSDLSSQILGFSALTIPGYGSVTVES